MNNTTTTPEVPAVVAGQTYRNPYDGNWETAIRILYVEGDEAVCLWRYANSDKNPLRAFVKSCSAIQKDWRLVGEPEGEETADEAPSVDCKFCHEKVRPPC